MTIEHCFPCRTLYTHLKKSDGKSQSSTIASPSFLLCFFGGSPSRTVPFLSSEVYSRLFVPSSALPRRVDRPLWPLHSPPAQASSESSGCDPSAGNGVPSVPHWEARASHPNMTNLVYRQMPYNEQKTMVHLSLTEFMKLLRWIRQSIIMNQEVFKEV